MPNGEPNLFPAISIKKHSSLRSSQLCHLKPVGIGTALVESMTSYLSRLARTHCWSTGTLLTFQIVPLINKSYMLGNVKGSTLSRIRKSLKAINGLSSTTTDFVRAAEALTLYDGLRFLTLLEWQDVLPTRHLFRNFKAWCPSCYRDWHTAGEIIYEPLLWTIEAVSICIHHRSPLITCCPHCSNQVALLDYFSSPGYCSECGVSLRNMGTEDAPIINQPSNDELKWQLWVTENIGNLLAASTRLPRPLSDREFHRSICACISRFGDGSLSKFATLIGKRKNTVWGWQQGKNRPTLLDILRICYQGECSLLEFVTADQALLYSNTPLKRHLSTPSSGIKKIRKARMIDHAVLKKGLEELLNTEKAVSVTEAARRMECSIRTLYRVSPELCKRISKRYSAFVSLRAKERRRHLYLDISLAVTHLHAKGINPTGRNVASFLNRPEYAFRSDTLAALREARCLLP